MAFQNQNVNVSKPADGNDKYFHRERSVPFPALLGRIGIMGDGTGSGGSSLTKDKSGYLLTSIPTTLSGEDEGTKLSGVSRSAP